MNINYHRLFNLLVGHDYFKDGLDRFMQIDPTSETIRLLQNGKMLFKRLPHGVTVLYRAGDDGVSPFVELSGEQRFTFTLNCDRKADLLSLTQLDESASRKYAAGEILFFTNNPAASSSNPSNPERISHSLLDSLELKLFTYEFRINGNPSTVQFRVTDAAGNPVSVGKDANGLPFPPTLNLVINSTNQFSIQVDLRNKPNGRYTLTVLDEAGIVVLSEKAIYANDELARKNTLGIVELNYDTLSGNLYGNTEEYWLQFRRAATIWKYYVVNKRTNIDFNSDTLSINDSGTTTGTPYQSDQFSRAYASLQITADATGQAGNSIQLSYSGTGEFPAAVLSGKTLSGGETGVAATGTITIVNNAAAGYTITINGVSFTEGSDFNQGATAAATAGSLRSAINASGATTVSASLLKYDVQIDNHQAVVFQSTHGIPFYEIPKTNLQLRKTPGNQVLVANLPNPSPGGTTKQYSGSPESEVYLYL
ncbi:hypothetical protein [Mangrovibacterium sp.]|uniref:hypothetical protein n=1 Tax=Mangrovibacterium sp. TaxID=1961364 RepID=UPI00356525A9